jgi:methylase of polypeptide subunit release factors
METFQKYATYYNLLYKDKNYKAEIEYIDHLLDEFNHANSSVLEFGSGTGIHGYLLSNARRFIQGI